MGECWVEDVIDVDREDLEEALFACGGDGVGGVIGVCPGVGAVGEAAVCELVYDAFVGVFLGAHEHQTGGNILNCQCNEKSSATDCSRVCGQPLSLKT